MTARGTGGEPRDSGVIGAERRIPEPDFRTLLESMPGSYLVLNAELVIVAVSDAYLRGTMTSRADITGRVIYDILEGSSERPGETGIASLRASLDRVCQDRVQDTMALQRYDVRRPESRGGGFEVRYSRQVNSPVLDTQGALAYIIHKVEDVTGHVRRGQQDGAQRQPGGEQERAGQMDSEILARSLELQQANHALRAENAAKNQFLTRVSHELRTPLNTVLGFGELLSFSDITAEHREWMSMMVQAAKQLLRLLDEVADISRIEAGQLPLSIEAVSVGDVIADVTELIRPLAISRGVELDPAPRLPTTHYVAADMRRLGQVLRKLMTNAVTYNHPGGRVTVTVDRQPAGRIRISVADTGRGIPEDQLAKLFLPFERLDAAQAGIEGTGLSLALSRQLIQTMDGATGVVSTEGKGSVFWIELTATEPIAFTQAAIGHDPIAASRTYAAPKKVLYIEDKVENLRLAEQILKQRPSATLIPVMLGTIALDVARQHRPDLILLDLELPDVPGQEVMRQLCADPGTSGIPIIVVSADARQIQIDQLLAAGATDYLTKPIRVHQLLEIIDHVLDQPAPEPAESIGAESTAALRHPGISDVTNSWGADS
jgi:signal transduction histidine kinase/CheY-like chemotaxis protein